jgi:hypothetical protein
MAAHAITPRAEISTGKEFMRFSPLASYQTRPFAFRMIDVTSPFRPKPADDLLRCHETVTLRVAVSVSAL